MDEVVAAATALGEAAAAVAAAAGKVVDQDREPNSKSDDVYEWKHENGFTVRDVVGCARSFVTASVVWQITTDPTAVNSDNVSTFLREESYWGQNREHGKVALLGSIA